MRSEIRLQFLIANCALVTLVNPLRLFSQCPFHHESAFDSTTDQFFGSAVCFDEQSAVVGARGDDGACPLNSECNSGAAYVLEVVSSSNQHKIVAPDQREGDGFGSAIAKAGEVVAIGAPGADDGCAHSGECNTGAVYLFRRQGEEWVFEQKILPFDPNFGALFGWSVSLYGNRLAVGTPYANGSMTETGAVYVYQYDGTTWDFDDKIYSLTGSSFDNFGYSVAIGEDSVLVGAPSRACGSGLACDEVNVFARTPTGWVQEAPIVPLGLEANDYFGIAIAVDADLAVIGSDGDSCLQGAFCGAAYVFDKVGQSWAENMKLISTDQSEGAFFGAAVSVRGPKIVVGEYRASCAADDCGAADVFVATSGTWTHAARLLSPMRNQSDEFGRGVATDGNLIVIGASRGDEGTLDGGAVYYFDSAVIPNSPDNTAEMPSCRFLSILNNENFASAIPVKLVSLHHPEPPYAGGSASDFSSFEGQVRWVGPPTHYVESSSNPVPFWSAELQCTPHYMDWSTVGVVHVTGREVVPSSVYDIRVIAEGCDVEQEGNYSAPLTISTSRWGDIEELFNPPSATVQPDVADISALVNKFRSAPGAPIKARALLAGDPPDPQNDLSFEHISACVDAFRGKPYPYGGPQPCP